MIEDPLFIKILRDLDTYKSCSCVKMCVEVFPILKVVTLFISGAKTPPNKHRRKNGSSRIDRCRRHHHGIVQ